MKGRFLRGVVAGGIAGLVKDVLNIISYYLLHFTRTRYLDLSAVLIFGHRPKTIAETIFAQMAEVGWSSVLGVFFCFLASTIGSRNYLLKSTFYGIAVWFAFFAVVVIHKMPSLDGFPLASAVSNLLTSAVYGIILGLVSQWLLQRDRGSI